MKECPKCHKDIDIRGDGWKTCKYCLHTFFHGIQPIRVGSWAGLGSHSTFTRGRPNNE